MRSPHLSRAISRLGALSRYASLRLALSLLALASVVLSTSVARAGAGSLPFRGVPPLKLLQTKAKYLVLIVLDGARPDYFNVTSLPHLDALRAAGTQFTDAFSGILESETPAAHATISTGSAPRRSGILGFSWAENDKNFSIFSPVVVRQGAMEQIMANAHAPTIAGLYKARYPSAVVVAMSGHKYYAADPLGGPQADVIEYFRGTLQNTYAPTAIPGHVPPQQILDIPNLTVPLNKLAFGQDDSLVTQLDLDTFALLHQRITLINYPDFDWPLGHVNGGNLDRPGVIALMQIFDRDLGLIEDAYKRAGILKQTLFVVTADHGMAPIYRFVPDSLFDNAVRAAGTTAPSITHNTATYIWLQDLAKGPAVAANILKARDPGIQSVYYLAHTKTGVQYALAPGWKLLPRTDMANQFLLRTLMNGHEPAVVAFCVKNASTSATSTHWKGDHGGSTWGVQHVPLVLAGPGIKKGFVTANAAQLEDIAPTVLVDMGVRPTGMEGKAMTEAFTDPYAADVAKRQQEIMRVQPVVNALVADDRGRK
jgi:arylsulfatase A-like enzyme